MSKPTSKLTSRSSKPVPVAGVRKLPNKLPSVLRDGADKRAGNRIGAIPNGLYPQISRTKLARICKRDVSTITGYLQGRTRPELSMAVLMAQAIGVSVERLNADLAVKQEERRARKRAGKVVQ